MPNSDIKIINVKTKTNSCSSDTSFDHDSMKSNKQTNVGHRVSRYSFKNTLAIEQLAGTENGNTKFQNQEKKLKVFVNEEIQEQNSVPKS